MELPIHFYCRGGYYAVIQVFERLFNRMGAINKLGRWLNILVTFILVLYGWMIFYAPDMQTVLGITKGYLHLGSPYIHQTTFFFLAIGFLILFIKDWKDEFYPDKHWFLYSKNMGIRYVSFASLVAIIVLFGVLGGGQFIYFKL